MFGFARPFWGCSFPDYAAGAKQTIRINDETKCFGVLQQNISCVFLCFYVVSTSLSLSL